MTTMSAELCNVIWAQKLLPYPHVQSQDILSNKFKQNFN